MFGRRQDRPGCSGRAAHGFPWGWRGRGSSLATLAGLGTVGGVPARCPSIVAERVKNKSFWCSVCHSDLSELLGCSGSAKQRGLTESARSRIDFSPSPNLFLHLWFESRSALQVVLHVWDGLAPLGKVKGILLSRSHLNPLCSHHNEKWHPRKEELDF